MADTLEYSNVAIPLNRIDPSLVDELHRPGAGEVRGLSHAGA